ncbi:MAG: hypothetical protein HY002_08470 [Candidatus Rokubacteria bacterium]|nr:hypothetical protein [Candidatus Rokubacteria bacterium]
MLTRFPVLVQGTVTVPAGTEVGVTVNGVVAAVSGGGFAALVPVDPSVSSLTATGADATGATGSDSIPVSVQAPAEPRVDGLWRLRMF